MLFALLAFMGMVVTVEIALTILRIAAGTQLLVLAYLIGTSANPIRVRILGAIVFFGFSWGMVAPVVNSDLAPTFGSLYMYPTEWIVPALLIFVCALFEDEFPTPLWAKLGVVIDIPVSFLFYTNLFGFANYTYAEPITAGLKLCLVFGAIYITLRGHKDDLILQRAHLRLFLVGSIALIALPVLLLQMSSLPSITVSVYLSLSCVIFLNTSIALIAFVKVNPGFELAKIPAVTAQTSMDNDIAYLLDRTTNERLYADHNLRLKSLADQIGWSESKLRNKVNQELGYRNFNQFVNHFRLDEAGVALLEQTDKAVLAIALDAGFRSISSFNSAFQSYFEMSPTKYREANRKQ